MKRAICIGLGMLAFVGQVSSAAVPAPPVAVGRVGSVTAPWSVSGVTLAMRPADVAAALKAAGYVLDYRYMGRSWQGEVANQVSNLRAIRLPAGEKVTSREDYRKGQEFIQVDYAAGPAGPYVARVNYRIPTITIDAERFKSAAVSRYGRPSIDGEWEDVYCSPQEKECSRIVSLVVNQLPSLTVDALDGMNRTIELRQGQRADLAYEAAVKAEAERLYPKKNKPSF
jgi:hypothetical protein